MNSEFWAITAYFNLAGWTSRRRNYRLFREALSLPLLTVEWHPEGLFQLGPGDANGLVQVSGGDRMWQKERLLGVALDALPRYVKYVAWVDADVLFCDPRWHERTRELLGHCAVVQPFDKATYLDAATTRALGEGEARYSDVAQIDGLWSRPSFGSVLDRVGDRIVEVHLGARYEQRNSTSVHSNSLARPAPGLAWAARTDVLRQIRIYDRCIVGGGDSLFSYGIIGKGEDLIARNSSLGWDFYCNSQTYRIWMQQASAVCRGRVRAAEGTLLHLYHGNPERRHNKSRIDGLTRFGVDLDRDVAAADGGPWAWTRHKEELNRYFMAYMRGRSEDS